MGFVLAAPFAHCVYVCVCFILDSRAQNKNIGRLLLVRIDMIYKGCLSALFGFLLMVHAENNRFIGRSSCSLETEVVNFYTVKFLLKGNQLDAYASGHLE